MSDVTCGAESNAMSVHYAERVDESDYLPFSNDIWEAVRLDFGHGTDEIN